MSIGRRFIGLVRSNLNNLLDRAAELDDAPRLSELSDEQLEAELQRRRTRRASDDRAAHRRTAESVEQQAQREVDEALRGSRYRTTRETRNRETRNHERVGRHAASPGDRVPRGQDARLARLYTQLECAYGTDLNGVRKQYRALMRKYHPDMHSGNVEKQRLATELSQRLTTAYNELRRALS